MHRTLKRNSSQVTAQGGHEYDRDSVVIHVKNDVDQSGFTHLVRNGPIFQPARLTTEAVALLESGDPGSALKTDGNRRIEPFSAKKPVGAVDLLHDINRSSTRKTNANRRTGLTEMKSHLNTKADEKIPFTNKKNLERELGEDRRLAQARCESNRKWLEEKQAFMRRCENDTGAKVNGKEGEVRSRKRRREASVVDAVIRQDPAQMEDYRDGMIKDMLQKEIFYRTGDFEKKLVHIRNRARQDVVDWIMVLHFKHRMRPETLYGCVFLLDRYLFLATDTCEEDFQFIAVACFLIASKFEEIEGQPLVEHLVQYMKIEGDKAVMDQAADMLREAEIKIMETVDFRFNVPSPYQFLLNFIHSARIPADGIHYYLAMFFLDCTLLDMQFLAMLPSHRAAASLYLAGQKLKINISDSRWEAIFNIPVDKVRYWSSCLDRWYILYESQAVFRKYRRPDHLNVISYIT